MGRIAQSAAGGRFRAGAGAWVGGKGKRRRMLIHEACCRRMFCAGLAMFARLMSGFTLDLMSLSIIDLEVLSEAGTPQDRLNAGTPSAPLAHSLLSLIVAS
jgi:hypothetical protein